MEICDNGIDDDNDGLIDLNDDDCQCQDVLDDFVFISNGDFTDSPSCCPNNNFSRDNCLNNWVPVNGSPEHINPDCFQELAIEEESIGIPFDSEMIGIKYNDFSSFIFKESFGICTNRTLEEGLGYRLEVDMRFTPKDEHNAGQGNPDMVFYGLKTCDELMFTEGTEGNLCELGFELIPLTSINFSEIPFTEWRTIKKTFTAPENIEAIIVSFECSNTVFSTKRFMFLDNIKISRLINQQFNVDLDIDPVGLPCADAFMLTAIANNEFDYQWYKNGVALAGQTGNTYELETPENRAGLYQLILSNAAGCLQSEEVLITADQFVSDTTICRGRTFDISTGSYDETGVYSEEIPSRFSCATFIYELEMQEPAEAESIFFSFETGSSFSFGGQEFTEPNTYEVVLKTAEGCDSLVNLVLSEIDLDIYVPNIFDPSLPNDDILTISGDLSSIETVTEFAVYDRWGNPIFRQLDFQPNLPEHGWNGRINNRSADPGVFLVYYQVRYRNGEIKEDWQPVTLIR